MKQITAARAVSITADDQREEHPVPVAGTDELAFLTDCLRQGYARLDLGLIGWPSYQGTLTLEDGDAFHVAWKEK